MTKVGDRVKVYEVTQEINLGAFCNSYFVSDGKNKYFMKEYSEPKAADPEAFTPFYENQCTLIEKLNKMGSITEKFIDHFVENTLYYQVKEPLYGENLDAYLGTHTEYEDRRLLSVILCGIVKNMHHNGIIHQDLKPAQVMLVNDEAGKKTKLGYRIILSDFDWSIPDGRCIQIVGTPAYKSPEHYKNLTPVPASDIFTVGIMIYEFLTGRNPYDFETPATDEEYGKRVLAYKVNKEPKAWNSEIPDDINSLIMKCLDPNLKKRPTLDDLQSALAGPITPGGLKQVTLESGTSKYIIYQDKEFGRNEIKQFFRDLLDNEGNQVYQYCDDNHPMLLFTKEKDGSLSISAPVSSKNYFLLNDHKIESERMPMKKGDKLQLFGTAKSKVVCVLNVT